MISIVYDAVHIRVGTILLVLDRQVFTEAVKRGKALRRAQAQRAREAQAATRAARKRAERSL